MKAKGIFTSFLMVLIIGAVPLIGQDDPTTLRQQMRDNVGTLRILRLTQFLNLTEEQTTRIYPLIIRVEKEKTRIHKNLAKDLQDLRKFLRDFPAGAEEPDMDRNNRLLEAVRKITESRRQIRTKDEELEVFLEKNLNPVQQARYVLFQIEFNQGLGDVLNRARMRRQGQIPPGATIKK
jgi:CRISPR/Cas system CSM-associated protein Csm2 small subunit